MTWGEVTRDTRMIDMTAGQMEDFINAAVIKAINMHEKALKSIAEDEKPKKHYVYGLQGLMELFQCSKSKACSLKKSGRIDAAIRQNGRKLVIDADMALKLYGE